MTTTRTYQLVMGVGLSMMLTTGWAATKPIKAATKPTKAPISSAATNATLWRRDQVRALLDKHMEMAQFIKGFASQADVSLLQELHGKSRIDLHTHAGSTLSLALDTVTLHLNGAAEPATLGQLVGIGVATPEHLLDLLEERLLRDAGRTGKQARSEDRATALQNARSTAQRQIAARANFRAVWGGDGRMAAPNPDIVLLSKYGTAVSGTTPRVVFPDGTEVTLGYYTPGDEPSLRSGKRDIDANAFTAMGFATPEAVQEVFSAQLLRAAGVHGSPTDQRALRRAREVLRARMKAADDMKEYLNHATNHRDVARLAAAAALFAAPGATPQPVVIATNSNYTLAVVAGKAPLQRIDRASGAMSDATFADLLRLEIGNYDKYDTAIGVAMTKMVDSDLVGK